MNIAIRVLPAVLAVHLLACGGATAPDMSAPTGPVCGSSGAPACPMEPTHVDPNYGSLCTSNSECTAPRTTCEYVGNGKSQCLATCEGGMTCPNGTVCSNDSYAMCAKTCVNDDQCGAGNVCFTVPSQAGLPVGTRVCVPDLSTGGGAGGAGGGGGSATGGGTGGSATGGGSGTPTVNQAEVLWKAQDSIHETSETLRDTWAAWMIDWLRDARSAAGASGNVTTGTLTETGSGSFTYASGTHPLRIVKASGQTFSIIVQQLVGSVASTSFPSGSDRLIGTFDMGSYTMQVDVTAKTSAFDGDYFDDAGTRTTVHVRHSKEQESFTYNGTYFLENNETFSGTVARGSTLVSYSTKKWLLNCTGTNCVLSGMTLDLDHDVTVTLPNGTFQLVYSTGFRQPSGALPTYAWEGDIWSGSSKVGGLMKRKVGTVTELNVTVGASLWRVRTVTEP
ncbi:MAG: hypothetical protein AB1938_22545 [Myxococcota bacterium]